MILGIGVTSFILFLLIGAFAGWLAGMAMRGRGYGFFGNIGIGIIGAILGGYIFNAIGLRTQGLLGVIITAFVGAVALLFVIGLFRGKK